MKVIERKHFLHTQMDELEQAKKNPENRRFFRLMRYPTPKGKRTCLSCGVVEFQSSGYGHRICPNCDWKINRLQPNRA